MLRFFWRGRYAATLALLAVPCGVHARCGRPPDPPARWQTFDFVSRFDESPASRHDSAFWPIRRFVSSLLPGHFETPRRLIFEYEPGFRDTGFRGSLDSLVANDAFPARLDGALIEVTHVTSGLGASDESLREFLAELEVDAVIVGQRGLFDAESQESVAVQPRVRETTLGYVPLSSDIWSFAELPEEWFDAAEAFTPAERNGASPGPLVFDSETRLPNAMASVLLNRVDARRATERTETPLPERRVVATLTVVFQRSSCRGFGNLDPTALRFPLASLSNDP